MNSYFAAEDPHKQDTIAAHQLSILGRYQADTQEGVAIFDLIKNRMGIIDNPARTRLAPIVEYSISPKTHRPVPSIQIARCQRYERIR